MYVKSYSEIFILFRRITTSFCVVIWIYLTVVIFSAILKLSWWVKNIQFLYCLNAGWIQNFRKKKIKWRCEQLWWLLLKILFSQGVFGGSVERQGRSWPVSWEMTVRRNFAKWSSFHNLTLQSCKYRVKPSSPHCMVKYLCS